MHRRGKGTVVADLQLYGINEAGETAHSEVLTGEDSDRVRALAAERLRQWHTVEVWDGPVCLIRVRRAVSDA
jgi:hypothetical protein